MSARDDSKDRDPAARKARDLKAQRKIAANSSDKAARRHARTIKAMANRKIRRKDRQILDPELEDSADQIKLEHQRKERHWGTNLAVDHRARQAEAHAHFRDVGGRNEAERLKWEDMRNRIDQEDLLKVIDETLARLSANPAKTKT